LKAFVEKTLRETMGGLDDRVAGALAEGRAAREHFE
jgi:hypothetical protein